METRIKKLYVDTWPQFLSWAYIQPLRHIRRLGLGWEPQNCDVTEAGSASQVRKGAVLNMNGSESREL